MCCRILAMRRNIFDKKITPVLIIAILGLAIYLNSLNGEFVWDDDLLITNNVYIKNFSNLPLIFTKDWGAGSGTKYHFYRPLSLCVYMVNYSLFRLDEWGYHLTSIILHILTSLALYWFILILWHRKVVAFLTGLLFLAHPIHSETVAYASNMSDCLVALFMLLCFVFYVKSLDTKNPQFCVFALVCYLASLFSKENSLILPGLLLVYHFSFKRKIEMTRFLPIVGLAFIYLAARLSLLKSVPLGIAPLGTAFDRLPGLFVAILQYVRLLILPFGLHMEYGKKLFSFTDPRFVLGFLLTVSLLVHAIRSRERTPIMFFSVFWFFTALLPVSNIYPLPFYMAEHYLYIPSIGFFLILANALSLAFSRNSERAKFLSTGFVVILVAFYSGLTIRQNWCWRTPIAFYKRILHFSPNSARLHYNLALAYTSSGELDASVESYKKAILYDPDKLIAYNNLALLMSDMGKKDEAIRLLNKALEINPGFTRGYNALALVYDSMNKKEKAIAQFKKAIASNGYIADPYIHLAGLYYEMQKTEEAASLYEEAISINPHSAIAYSKLARLKNDTGSKEEAITLYKKSIKVNPDDQMSYFDLGKIYADMGKHREAIKYYEKNLELDPKSSRTSTNIGVAYVLQGRKDKAISAFKKAITLNPGNALAHSNIAVMYYYKKEYEKAIEHSDTAEKLGADNRRFREFLKPHRR